MMAHVEYAYILVNGTIALATQKVNSPDNGDKEVLFKNCAPFTDCVSEINNNTQIDNAKDNDAVMPMYHLVVYSDNYSKHQEVYGITIDMNQLWLIMALSLIFLLLITEFRLN